MSAALRSFGKFFVIATLYAVAFYFTAALVPETWHGVSLIVSACILLIAFIAIVSRRPLWPALFGGVLGVSWGFLIALSVVVSIQNARVSINWPTFLPALALVPATITLLSFPFITYRRWSAERRARRALAPDVG